MHFFPADSTLPQGLIEADEVQIHKKIKRNKKIVPFRMKTWTLRMRHMLGCKWNTVGNEDTLT